MKRCKIAYFRAYYLRRYTNAKYEW